LKPDYEIKATHCGQVHHEANQNLVNASPTKKITPFGGSSIFQPSSILGAQAHQQQMATVLQGTNSSPNKKKIAPSMVSPGKIRGYDGASHEMTSDEMK